MTIGGSWVKYGVTPMRVAQGLLCALLCVCALGQAIAQGPVRTLTYFPVGPIYEYRWKVLELALDHVRKAEGVAIELQPYDEKVTQNRGIHLLQSGAIDVIALGTDPEREVAMRPIRIDISRGIVGYRVFLISEPDQDRIARMDDDAFRKQLTFGLSSQWADVPVMRANGYTVVTATEYDRLFPMLAAHRFDALPRGIGEAGIELKAQRQTYPQLAIENTRALFFPYPIYFWVSLDDVKLAGQIERGLDAALADGSFQRLFQTYHASVIKDLKRSTRRVIRLDNPLLSADAAEIDTRWWWR
ncbi:substrate-binding periplasmic protein [Castellaniella sp.]|uniref:substrate-binding periplasmic protein n=1 Tax=Castellaniella sp. TaxID=1955812 RepID=UPI003C738E7B